MNSQRREVHVQSGTSCVCIHSCELLCVLWATVHWWERATSCRLHYTGSLWKRLECSAQLHRRVDPSSRLSFIEGSGNQTICTLSTLHTLRLGMCLHTKHCTWSSSGTVTYKFAKVIHNFHHEKDPSSCGWRKFLLSAIRDWVQHVISWLCTGPPPSTHTNTLNAEFVWAELLFELSCGFLYSCGKFHMRERAVVCGHDDGIK